HMYFAYVLGSLGKKFVYKGHCEDLQKRLKQHNAYDNDLAFAAHTKVNQSLETKSFLPILILHRKKELWKTGSAYSEDSFPKKQILQKSPINRSKK
ncbi:MAG: hypothetical protein SH819_02995, partial [Cytophagales bacterium]|nr:hypothetical protein [Cytophagales bacterium]